MGYYRANDIIKMTREMLGITQEELSDGICAVKNLSMMENGHSKIKMTTYRRLMAKMERMPEKIFAVGMGKDMEILEERQLFETYMRKQEFKEAGKYLQILDLKVGDDIINRQFLKRIKAIYKYYTEERDDERLIDELDKALRMTLPEYEKFLGTKYPIVEQEQQLLMNLANAYGRLGEHDKAIELYEALCVHLEHGPQDIPQIRKAKIAVNYAYGHSLIDWGRYKEAEAYLKRVMEWMVQENDGMLLSSVIEKQVIIEKKGGQEKEVDQRKLRQAYYLAASRNDKHFMEVIKKGYKDEFSF